MSDEAVLAMMLMPINGLEPKEKEEVVREAMAESVMALANTEAGRKALWKVKAPEHIQKGWVLAKCPHQHWAVNY